MVRDNWTHSLERIAILVIAIYFVVWSTAFIYRTSFVGIDGKRYFSLFDDAYLTTTRVGSSGAVRQPHREKLSDYGK